MVKVDKDGGAKKRAGFLGQQGAKGSSGGKGAVASGALARNRASGAEAFAAGKELVNAKRKHEASQKDEEMERHAKETLAELRARGILGGECDGERLADRGADWGHRSRSEIRFSAGRAHTA